jgi:Raf kinase inhibitor-like YbhB/YbcL family protein
MRNQIFTLAIWACGIALVGGCRSKPPAAPAGTTSTPKPMNFTLKSTAFADNTPIPATFTCDGADKSPSLEWSGAPKETKSFALVCLDPDAPNGAFTHWIVSRIPITLNRLPEGLAKVVETPDGIRQGKNGFGNAGYGGPCPPAGKVHHYRFQLHALDTEITLGPESSQIALENEIQLHKIATAELTGTYQK